MIYFFKARKIKFVLILLAGFAGISSLQAETVGLFYDSTIAQHKFAAGDIKAALEAKNFQVESRSLSSITSPYPNKKVVLALASNSSVTSELTSQGGSLPPSLGAQAYQIRTTTQGQTSYWVLGGDANGAMYGGLQIAENIQFNGFSGNYDERVNPNFLQRGLKLNLPLDARIPTYSGTNGPTSAKKAIPHVWDINFWKTWLDEQARNRYNVLSVWVQHPFPAIVKVPDYPLAALPSIEGYDGYKNNLNIDQRIAFWKEVMKYAHDRGFQFYFFCWNVAVDYAEDKYPAITDLESNNATITYLSKSMKALLETYPELDGFGISAGDNMDLPKDDRPAWTWKAYGKAAYDYAIANPNRKFTIIHRGLGTALTSVYKDWEPLTKLNNFKFDYSIKYANAHMFSTLTPRAYDSDMKDASSANQKTWLTLRNDDYFYLDMGDPKFVRDFLDSIPYRNVINSFYIGSDIYQPTRAYFYKNASMNGQLEIQRNWYIQKLWGRISYQKDISDNVFKNYMANRFSPAVSNNLFTAWSLASRALPKFQELTGDNWHLDAHWYAEASAYPDDGDTWFRDIASMGSTGVAESSPLCDIPTTASNGCGKKVTAYMLADTMENYAKSALSIINSVSAGGNSDLDVKIKNVKQQAYLATYLAYKIRGATFKKAGGTANLASSKEAMAKAYCWWMTYAGSMGSMYVGNSFRTVDMGPDWTFGDKWNLDDYKTVAGNTAATPKCDDLVGVDSKTIFSGSKPISIQSFTAQGLIFDLPQEGLATVTVYSSSGKIIFQVKAFSGKAGSNHLKFTNKLGIGLHFVQIKSGNSSVIKKSMMNTLR